MLITKKFSFSKKLRKKSILRLTFLKKLSKNLQYFSYTKCTRSAYSSSGLKLIRTRKKVFKFRKYKLFDYSAFSKMPSTVSTIFLNLSRNFFTSHVQTSTGVSSLIHTATVRELFHYCLITPKKKYILDNNITFILMESISKRTRLSMVSSKFRRVPVYSRSNGVFSLILGRAWFSKVAKMRLPSWEVKTVSILALCKVGALGLPQWKKIRCSKVSNSGKSFKSIKVRGIAKNPVDHPHGGSTKSIKWHRTPWGFSTKN